MVRYLASFVALSLLASNAANAACLSDQKSLYVVSSSLNLRKEPRADAPIVDTLPIGASIVAVPEELSGRGEDSVCGSPVKGDWISVCIRLDEIDPVCPEQAHGWALKDMVAAEPPSLATLLANYDQAPEDNLTERRKWAERAAALAPLDPGAQQRILTTLTAVADEAALQAWKTQFAKYANPTPTLAPGEKRAIFILQGSHLHRYCVLTEANGCDRTSDDRDQNQYMNGGKVYLTYSGGVPTGGAVIESRYCLDGYCAVRGLPVSQGKPPSDGLATNFVLASARKSESKISPEEVTTLTSLASRWANTQEALADDDQPCPSEDERCEKYRAAKQQLREEIASGDDLNSMMAARSPRGRMLVGLWVIGDAGGSHYGDEPLFVALLIAEKNDQGRYQVSFGNVSRDEFDDCRLWDHADVDGDGTDEIFGHCNGIEDEGGVGLLITRKGNVWKKNTH